MAASYWACTFGVDGPVFDPVIVHLQDHDQNPCQYGRNQRCHKGLDQCKPLHAGLRKFVTVITHNQLYVAVDVIVLLLRSFTVMTLPATVMLYELLL